jgi:diguanylate cyclase (GGDEF)-like protein
LNNSSLNFLPPWIAVLRSVAVALLAKDGSVIEANQGFLATFPDLDGGSAADCILEPPFASWSQAPVAGDSSIYDGLIRLGSAQGIRRTFSGNIYRLNQGFLLVAELDIAVFEQLSSDAERLSIELDDVKRQLVRRNHALQSAQEEVRELQTQDALTGLPLRRMMDVRMDLEVPRWERYRRPLALLIMDIDRFSLVNDGYGREVGDEILKHIATIVKQSIRTVDLAVRYGGQEFAVLMPETNEIGALIVAERLRMELEDQIILPLVKPLSASFGVAMLMPDEPRQELYVRAERALSHSKKNGRNCVTMAGVISECDYVYNAQGSGKEGGADV